MHSHELGSTGLPQRKFQINYYPRRELHYNAGLICEEKIYLELNMEFMLILLACDSENSHDILRL
jgi:hypothetical protein